MTMEIPLRDRQRRTSSRTATAQNRMTKILMTNAYNTLRAHHRLGLESRIPCSRPGLRMRDSAQLQLYHELY